MARKGKCDIASSFCKHMETREKRKKKKSFLEHFLKESHSTETSTPPAKKQRLLVAIQIPLKASFNLPESHHQIFPSYLDHSPDSCHLSHQPSWAAFLS